MAVPHSKMIYTFWLILHIYLPKSCSLSMFITVFPIETPFGEYLPFSNRSMLVYYRATLKTTITQRRQNQSDMVVSIDVGTPIAGWFIMEDPIKMDGLGVPL